MEKDGEFLPGMKNLRRRELRRCFHLERED
jgi:hypothetical protein